MGVIIAVTAVVLLYCIAFGTVILNVFNPEGDGVIQHGSKSKASLPASSPELSNVLTSDSKGEENVSGSKYVGRFTSILLF
jgi:hypothetical protein